MDITGLEYANNVVFFVDKYDEMQIMLNNKWITAARIGFKIIINKTKGFSPYIPEADKIHFFISSFSTEEVPEYKYLGSTLNSPK